MLIIIDILLIILSLALLILGAEWLLKGAVVIAKKINVSDLVIASTLIAFGTALPTIAVNIALVIFNENGSQVAIGSVLGTSFFNIGIGLGIPAFLITLVTKYQVFEKEIPIYLAMVGLLTSFAMDGTINRIEGFIILLGYIVTLIIIYQYSRREKLDNADIEQVDLDTSTMSETKVKGTKLPSAYIFLVMGLLLLIFTSILLALFVPTLSRDLGISEYIIGLTIVGIGTSLPTIVTSVRSALKGYVDIVLGNIFGGTIATIGLGLGFVSIIAPLSIDKEAVSDIYYLNMLNIIVIFSVLIEMKLLGGNKTLSKVSGILIIGFYFVYLVSKFL